MNQSFPVEEGVDRSLVPLSRPGTHPGPRWQLLQLPRCQSHLSCSLLLGAGAGANAQSCQVWTVAEDSLVRDGGNQSGRAGSSRVTAAVSERWPGTIYNSQVPYQVRTAIKRPNTLLWLPGAFKIKAQILTGSPRAWQELPLSPLSRVTHTGLFSSWDVQPAHPPRTLPIYSFFCLECSPHTLCLANLCQALDYMPPPQRHPAPAPSLHLNWAPCYTTLHPCFFPSE